MVALAGSLVVELIMGDWDPEVEDQSEDDCDLPRARRHDKAIIGEDATDAAVDTYLDKLRAETVELLRQPVAQDAIRTIAKRLPRIGNMPGEEVRQLLEDQRRQ